eukprot:TRINITY_DN96236_c0_g1_i1.p1 TRINITY_DN96236_c0_g1~~TRINITY_DN96236_c0_g1_i1.p1  ORF type:complete len:567 (+),score=106.39 TRINITY_DN96236_c0_g1_i1:36-1703(+)
MVKSFTLLAVAGLALAAAQNFQDLHKLGVNFAFPRPETGNLAPKLAQKAASLGVVRVKLFVCDPWVVYQLRKYYAFAKAKLEIMVGMPQWIAKPPLGKPENPVDWNVVKACAETITNNSDIVTGVFVFNEPCVHGLCFDGGGKDLFDILGYYTQALKDHGMQVNVPFSSSCIFPLSPNKVGFFQTVVRLLNQTKSPITINLYPYLDYAFKPFSISVNQALGSEGLYGPQTQWSQIDMDIARVHNDMAKLGPEFKDTPVQIGESGWSHAYGAYPQQWESDLARKHLVYQVTTPEYANRFYLNLVKRLHSLHLSGIYIFELGSELWKPAAFPAYGGEKHFGISGLYKDPSKAPWHIDNPSHHPPWTGFATMRPEDWKQFDDEQAGLQARVKQNPQDWLAVNQLKVDTPGAEKLRGETVKEQLKRDEKQWKTALRTKALECTPSYHDMYDDLGKVPCCKDLVAQKVRCRGTDVCVFCMPSNETSDKILDNIAQKWQSTMAVAATHPAWVKCAAGAVAASMFTAGVMVLRRARFWNSVLEVRVEESCDTQVSLETAILE